MSVAVPDLRLPGRSHVWKWWVCGLLLLATMVNYMDRLTLNLLAPRIMGDLGLSKLDYGRIEAAFALAFAFGPVLLRSAVDRRTPFWVSPAAVLLWSAAGPCARLDPG